MDVLDWLLDGDPAIRWQVLRDLTGASPAEVSAERSRVADEGWGAQLLSLQQPDGSWAGGACFPGEFPWSSWDWSQGQPWTSTLPTLQLLRDLGVDPADPRVAAAVARVAEGVRWEHAGQRFFDGEVEACINGRTVAIGAYAGQPVDGIVARLLAEQLEDGGWNCETENGSVRASFHSTICVLEGLREHGSPTSAAARTRGEEYLLSRSLFRRASTGEPVETSWSRPAFPTWWHYDVLRGLTYFWSLGGTPDPRLHEAVEVVRALRQPDGRWLLDRVHPGPVLVEVEQVGQPSRWVTLQALRVLRWWDAAPGGPGQAGLRRS